MPLTLDQALDDVCCRFIYNLPSTDKNIPHRLLLNVEAALWFYDDHVRPGHESYPPFRLANFCRLMFIRDPLLSQLITQIPQLLEKFSLYKLSIPVAGVILLNPTMSKCLMVRGHRSKDTWNFPKGKVNEGESLADCAVRELFEETGYQCQNGQDPFFLLIDISEATPFLEWKDLNGRLSRLYILKNISEETAFGWQTRNEIYDIAWHNIEDTLVDIASIRKRYVLALIPLDLLSKWIHTERGVAGCPSKRATSTVFNTETTNLNGTNRNLPVIKTEFELVIPAFPWKTSLQKAIKLLYS